jgi:predicted CDP-diglyceride synthetase/phosphatidate cytidylyltransferase
MTFCDKCMVRKPSFRIKTWCHPVLVYCTNFLPGNWLFIHIIQFVNALSADQFLQFVAWQSYKSMFNSFALPQIIKLCLVSSHQFCWAIIALRVQRYLWTDTVIVGMTCTFSAAAPWTWGGSLSDWRWWCAGVCLLAAFDLLGGGGDRSSGGICGARWGCRRWGLKWQFFPAGLWGPTRAPWGGWSG